MAQLDEDLIEGTKAVLAKETDPEIIKTYLSAWMHVAADLLDQDQAHLKALIIEHGQLKNDDLNETARSTLRWERRMREQIIGANGHRNGITKKEL